MPRPDSDADSLAELCLSFLAEDPGQLAEFMAAAGYTPKSLMAARHEDALRHGLIDYFAANEPLLLALCANNGLKPEAFMRVWHRHNPTS
jgi:hypothetical protein